MKKNTYILNAEYIISSGAFWMIYAVVGSFASVFMLSKGYDNTDIGITIAAANVLALILQPWIADRTDRSGREGIIRASVLMTAIMMLSGAGLFTFKDGGLALALVFVIIIAVHTVMQPLMNSLAFKLSRPGVSVSFAIGRAGGSIGYSLILAALGTLVEKHGVMVMPLCCELICLSLIIMLVVTRASYNRISNESHATGVASDAHSSDEIEEISLCLFIRRNRMFFIMNLGICGLFFSNGVLSNYMPQIAASVGGSTADAGRVLSLMAMAELPTMLLFGLIKKRFSGRLLIKVAAIGLTAKILVCWLARSVGMLFAAQGIQLFAFALMMPAMVYFTDEIMSPGEAVKGQALFTMMITLSSIAASFIGGRILDASGARTMCMVAAIVTAIGAAVVLLSTDRVRNNPS